MEERNHPHKSCQDCLKKGRINPSSMTIECHYCYIDLSENPLTILLCENCYKKRRRKSEVTNLKLIDPKFTGESDVILYIGFVGSRRYKDEEYVRKVVRSIVDKDDVLVSGGAKGPDSYAESEAKKLKAKTVIFRPDLRKVNNKYDAIKAYYERNRKIAERSDIIHAFVVDDKGGTWNTIKWAKKLGKMVIIHKGKESYIFEDNA